jgi:4-hydroxy-tetrahydrodipicolinate synthase
MRLEDYILQSLRPLDVLIGCDSLFLNCLVAGGVGTVTGPGMIFAEYFVRLYKLYREGDIAEASRLQSKIVEMDRKLAPFPPISALKAMFKMREVISNDLPRKPNRTLSNEEYEALELLFNTYLEDACAWGKN